MFLNPHSSQSGVFFRNNCNEVEQVKDQLVGEQIKASFNKPLSFAQGIEETYNIIQGHHYSPQDGKKGALDYLIFPLLARKLLTDTRLPKRDKTPVVNTLAYIIAAPLELVRFSMAISLTLALLPVIALVHACKALLNGNENNNEDAQPSITPSL